MTRRDAVNRLTARLVPLYGEREARAIARNAIAELAGIPLSALLTDPGAEFAAAFSFFDNVQSHTVLHGMTGVVRFDFCVDSYRGSVKKLVQRDHRSVADGLQKSGRLVIKAHDLIVKSQTICFLSLH